jgi:hypothetical protein
MIESKKRIIRQAKISDKKEIILFLKQHWSEKHVLVENEELFDWQYLNNDSLNFIISINKKRDEIESILGFIPLSRYDSEANKTIAWGALWKTRVDAPFGLGKYLLNYLTENLGYSNYLTLGLSQISVDIYKQMNFKISNMNHYYMLSDSINKFNILEIERTSARKIVKESKYCFSKVKDLENVVIKNKLFKYKTVEYIINRYKTHPFYKYIFYGLELDSKLKTIFVIRKQKFESTNCIRIIDMIGEIDDIGDISISIQKILKDNKSEYIDCYNYGIEPKIFKQMGFKLKKDEKIIIPNYFEPFLRKNIEIFCSSNSVENFIFFKGDGDQDRPNII